MKGFPTGPVYRLLSLSDSVDVAPSWIPDGRYVLFLSNRDGRFKVCRRRADGSASTELLFEDEQNIRSARLSPDGTWLVYQSASNEAGHGDIMGIRLGVDTEPRALVATDFTAGPPA